MLYSPHTNQPEPEMADSNQIAKIAPKHDAIMTFLIANPAMKKADVARHFGVTPAWLSTIIHSDIFQAKLRERQDEFFGVATETIKEKLTRLAEISLDGLIDNAEATCDPHDLREASKIALKGLGYGEPRVAQVPAGNVTNNYLSVDASLLAAARERIFNHGAIEHDAPRQIPAAAGQGAAEEL